MAKSRRVSEMSGGLVTATDDSVGTVATDGTVLFAALECGSSTAEALVDEWTSKGEECKQNLLTLLNMILLAAGVKPGISPDYFKRKSVEPSFVIGELIDSLSEKGDPEYPVAEKKGKAFRKQYTAFFKELGRMISNSTHSDTFKTVHLSWILTMSSVGYRPIRIAATLAGLAMYEGIAYGSGNLSKQVDKLNKMKKRKDSEGATLKIAHSESLIGWLTEGLLIQRYRDVDAGIRGDVLRTLGECIISINPEIFLDNAYLRYIGWSLSDKEDKLRLTALAILRQLYSSNKTALIAFTERFKSRILEMALKDVSVIARDKACELVDKMHLSGLLITEECVDLVKDIVDRRAGLTSLPFTANQVIFGQASQDMQDPNMICKSISAFTDGTMHNIDSIIQIVHIDHATFIEKGYSSDVMPVFLSVINAKGIKLSTECILNYFQDIRSDSDRAAIFNALFLNTEYSDALLEAVMNELINCRTEDAAALGIKVVNKWRDSELVRLRVEQWIQSAISTCWEQIQQALSGLAKRKIDENVPYVPLSLLSAVSRCRFLNTENLSMISSAMEQLEGLVLLQQRGKKKNIPFTVYHRCLLLLYNDVLWAYSENDSDKIDRLCNLKQLATLSRPIIKQDASLLKIAIAILTDIALISKTTDDTKDIISNLQQLTEGVTEEWKAIIVGRLFMSGLLAEPIAIPILCLLRTANKTCLEICKAAIEKSKSSSADCLVQILIEILDQPDALKFAITHYRPVLKGTGSMIQSQVAELHTRILQSTKNDQAGSWLGFLLEEVETETFPSPPAPFKLYRKTIGKLIRVRNNENNTSELNLPSEDLSSEHQTRHDFTLTSPGIDDDSPSLPNSPLDKIIRLE